MNYVPGFEIMADWIFWLYLLWAAYQDIKEMQVVRYTHLLGIAGICLQAFLHKDMVLQEAATYLAAIIILCFLQVAAARLKLYGVADAIVLFMCGIFLLAKAGADYYLFVYLIVQAVSGILLLAVQTVKRNVKKGKLLRPVPYIPYICFAFILTNVVL